jgi:hypothetical protein
MLVIRAAGKRQPLAVVAPNDRAERRLPAGLGRYRGLSSLCAPQPEFNVLGGCVKVLVRRQQGQIVSATELDE